ISILLKGNARNEELRNIYMELNLKNADKLHDDFKNSDVSSCLLDDEFLVFFVHSLMLGYESFASLGSKKVFKDNKGFIKEIIISYLKKINKNQGGN
ncbi:MAG: hypothetical protein ACLT9Z_07840, partial [Finegoldia magna]